MFILSANCNYLVLNCCRVTTSISLTVCIGPLGRSVVANAGWMYAVSVGNVTAVAHAVHLIRLVSLTTLLSCFTGDRVRYEEIRDVHGRVHLVPTQEYAAACVAQEAARERLDAWLSVNALSGGVEQNSTHLPRLGRPDAADPSRGAVRCAASVVLSGVTRRSRVRIIAFRLFH